MKNIIIFILTIIFAVLFGTSSFVLIEYVSKAHCDVRFCIFMQSIQGVIFGVFLSYALLDKSSEPVQKTVQRNSADVARINELEAQLTVTKQAFDTLMKVIGKIVDSH